MRTSEERIKAMHKRAGQLESEKRLRRARLMGTICVAASLVLVVGLAAFMPEIAGMIAPGGDAGSMNASIFANSHALGYIIIALLAFALGVSVTIFCYYLKRFNQQGDDFEDKPYTDQEDDL